MKMEVLGIERVGRTSVKMVTDVDGHGWVVKATMVPQNGKKRYNHFFIVSFYLINYIIYFLISD